MRRVCYPYTDGLTAAGGTYTLCTAPDSRSTVWKPLVEAYTTLDLPALVTTMSTRRGLLGRSGNDCGGGEGEGGKGRRGRRGERGGEWEGGRRGKGEERGRGKGEEGGRGERGGGGKGEEREEGEII